MTTRFKHLKLILYDFLGVFIVMAPIVVASYLRTPASGSFSNGWHRRLGRRIFGKRQASVIWYTSCVAVPWCFSIFWVLLGMVSIAARDYIIVATCVVGVLLRLA